MKRTHNDGSFSVITLSNNSRLDSTSNAISGMNSSGLPIMAETNILEEDLLPLAPILLSVYSAANVNVAPRALPNKSFQRLQSRQMITGLCQTNLRGISG